MAAKLDTKRTGLSAIIDRAGVSVDSKVLIQVNLTIPQFLREVVAA